MPRSAAILGYAGLLPFGAAIAALLLDWHSQLALTVFTSYGAAILAFLGGLQWGLALFLDDARFSQRLIAGVIPPLLAWLAVLAPAVAALPMLAAGFIGVYLYDRRCNAPALPNWYGRLRLHLSAGVVVCHVVALLAGV